MDKKDFLNAGIPQRKGLNGNGQQSFLIPNSSIHHYSNFETAFGSMASSPSASTAFPAPAAAAIRYVLANSGHTNDSCCNSALSSPSKLHLRNIDQIKMANLGNPAPLPTPPLPFASDHVFPARAAKFSCSGMSFSGGETPVRLKNSPLMGNGKFSRVFSSSSIDQAGSPSQNKYLGHFQKEMTNTNGVVDKKLIKLSGTIADSGEKSSVSEKIPNGETGCKASNEMNFRKRKAISRGKMKTDGTISAKEVAGDEDEISKRTKPTESCKSENGDSEHETEKRKSNQKPLKDYIHVRARRGEATDSHSLAERVRREKISKRMKLLQDLVPGCNKVIGKAVMLDEIINYVESLQRQVEFLSMKLASLNPGLDFKNMFQQSAITSQQMHNLDSSAASFYEKRCQNTDIPNELFRLSSVDPIHLDASFCHNLGVQLSSVVGFTESFSQFSDCCQDDLHSIVQMEFGQNPANFPVENPLWEAN